MKRKKIKIIEETKLPQEDTLSNFLLNQVKGGGGPDSCPDDCLEYQNPNDCIGNSEFCTSYTPSDDDEGMDGGQNVDCDFFNHYCSELHDTPNDKY